MVAELNINSLENFAVGWWSCMARPTAQAISLENFCGTDRSAKLRNFSTLNDLQYMVLNYYLCVFMHTGYLLDRYHTQQAIHTYCKKDMAMRD